jgi:hypothetical protein
MRLGVFGALVTVARYHFQNFVPINRHYQQPLERLENLIGH